jgi:glyoxylase-like metal-dependent hydrolase (beta-lactamase superfamily II)
MGCSEVKILRIDYELDGKRSIYPALLRDERGSILIDCGYPGFLPLLERAAERAGAPLGEVTGIVITHPDRDHCGALRELTEKYPRVSVMSSEFDAPYIEGKKPPLRAAMWLETHAPPSGGARKFREKLEAAAPVKVARALAPGEIMPWCGGTEIIATPGHMPGHISLYARALKTLITGDALIAARGKLRMSHPRYAVDAREARRTAAALLAMDAEKFVCYHGGVVTRREDGLKFGE